MHDGPRTFTLSDTLRPPGSPDTASRMKAAGPGGPDRTESLQADVRRLLADQRQGRELAMGRTRHAVAGISGFLGLLGLAVSVAQWADVSLVKAPVPSLSFVIGLVLLAAAALVWRSHAASIWVTPAIAAVFGALLSISLVVNGHVVLTVVPVAVLFLHIVLAPNAALGASAALLAVALGAIAWVPPEPEPMPVWRLWGAACATLVIAQWLRRVQGRLDRLNHQAIEGMERLLDTLGDELMRSRRDQREAERALWTAKEAEGRVQTLMSLMLDAMESVASGIMVVDDRKRVTAFNHRFAELLDLPLELLERRPNLSEVVAFQSLRGDFGKAFERIDPGLARWVQSEIEGREEIGLERYVRRTAAGKVLEFHTIRSSTGQLVRTVNDVTAHQALTDQLAAALSERDRQIDKERALQAELKQALLHAQDIERSLARSDTLLTGVLRTLPQALMLFDDEGRLQLFNDRASEMLRIPSAHLEEHPHWRQVTQWQAERGGTLFEPLQEPTPGQGRDGQAAQREDRRLAVSDGRHFEVRTWLLESHHTVRIFSDVTSYIQAQDALRISLEQLRQTEERLQSELVKSREALNLQANFVASVSHELRTPLNGIAGMGELLSESRLDATQSSHLQDLRAAAHQLRMLIDELLDLSKVSAPGFRLESTVFDLYKPLEDSLISARMMARGKPIDIRFERQEPPRSVRGDPLRLGQIANNLLSNAVKFTDKGTVSMSAAWSPKPGDAQRIVLELVVRDTGRGIDPSLHQLIFEPFHQGDASTNRTHGGTGLGLALTRQLVAAMGGTIEMSSEPGVGTTFKVHLELDSTGAAELAASSAPDAAPTLVRLEGVRVLVADDNKVNQKLLSLWLAAAGAVVTQVFDGAAALRVAAEQTFDVILMDVAMPEMTGLDAVRALRQLATSDREALRQRARVPVIGVTAMARPQDREMCIEAGMTAHQSKPYARAELLRAIQQVLRSGS